jgi:hypothetical protein
MYKKIAKRLDNNIRLKSEKRFSEINKKNIKNIYKSFKQKFLSGE